jgi:F-box/WD-40 domain protein 7
MYTGGSDALIKRWIIDTPGEAEVDAVLKGHSGAVLALAMAGCYLVSASHDRSVRVWDMESGTCAAVLSGHSEPVACAAVRGQHLYTGSHDRTVRKWDLDTMRCVACYTGHTDYVRAVAVDARWLYSGSDDNSVRVWETESEQVGVGGDFFHVNLK